MVKNFISAKDARNLTENSDKLLNVAFKTIKESAEYGNNQTQFSVFETDPKVVDRICQTLITAGYTIEKERFGENEEEFRRGKVFGLKISW
jgi:hypothetical protein